MLSSSHLPACQVEHLSVHSIIHSFVHSFRHALCKPTLRSTWAQPAVRQDGFRDDLTQACPEGACIRALRAGRVTCAWGWR